MLFCERSSRMLIYRQEKWGDNFQVWRSGTKIAVECIYCMASGKLCVRKGTALSMGQRQRGTASLQMKFPSGKPLSSDLVGPRHILPSASGGWLAPRNSKLTHLKLFQTFSKLPICPPYKTNEILFWANITRLFTACFLFPVVKVRKFLGMV